MRKTLSIRIGDFLYHNLFPVYNFVYPIFKRKQDAFEIKLLERFINPGDTIVDIGANIGFYSKILSKLSGPDGNVFSFEPDPKNYKYLCENVKGISNITTLQKAVDEKTGKLKIYISNLLNVDHSTYPVENPKEVIEIDAVSLDDFFGNQKIDFIKMDIQGAELFALKGMKNLLANNPHLKILTEFWPYGFHRAKVSSHEFLQFVQENGFLIYELKENSLTAFKPADEKVYNNPTFEYYQNIVLSKEPISI